MAQAIFVKRCYSRTLMFGKVGEQNIFRYLRRLRLIELSSAIPSQISQSRDYSFCANLLSKSYKPNVDIVGYSFNSKSKLVLPLILLKR